jgi:hypothetical protein
MFSSGSHRSVIVAEPTLSVARFHLAVFPIPNSSLLQRTLFGIYGIHGAIWLDANAKGSDINIGIHVNYCNRMQRDHSLPEQNNFLLTASFAVKWQGPLAPEN